MHPSAPLAIQQPRDSSILHQCHPACSIIFTPRACARGKVIGCVVVVVVVVIVVVSTKIAISRDVGI